MDSIDNDRMKNRIVHGSQCFNIKKIFRITHKEQSGGKFSCHFFNMEFKVKSWINVDAKKLYRRCVRININIRYQNKFVWILLSADIVVVDVNVRRILFGQSGVGENKKLSFVWMQGKFICSEVLHYFLKFSVYMDSKFV